MKNVIPSIQTRLRNLAQSDGKNYQLILIRYFQERLIYRLSVSSYCDHFCLKGGALLYALQQEKSRPTLDIDLLGLRIRSEQLYLKQVFTEICQKTVDPDGVTFKLETLTTSEIAKEGKYAGVRVKVDALLGTMRQTLQIDIGFGDIVVPQPVFMVYPTLLVMDQPQIWAYSIESVIAEKFEAMIDLAETNSRMKDFYDVFNLLRFHPFPKPFLQEAIIQTFRKRNTRFNKEHPLFKESFAMDPKRVVQWQSFLRKSKLDETIDFKVVLKTITENLYVIYEQV